MRYATWISFPDRQPILHNMSDNISALADFAQALGHAPHHLYHNGTYKHGLAQAYSQEIDHANDRATRARREG